MTDNNFVALVHESCPICGADVNEQIMLHTRLRDISELDQKSIGYGNPCAECQAALDQGAIMVIVCDKDKSGPEFKDLYRTGNIFGLKQSAVERMLGGNPEGEVLLEDILKKRVMILDYRDAKDMGFPVEYVG